MTTRIHRQATVWRRAGLALFAAAIVLLLPRSSAAQSYASGQPVWPAFEGWERNDDGTFNMVFGYMNDNWEAEVDVPVGADNSFSPGPADHGQPTHFLPRRNRFIFRVRVPKDFGTKELVWTLKTQGKEQKAYGSLRLDLLIENVDIMSETGALGAGASDPVLRGDKAPVVKIEGDSKRSVKVGEPLALTALVTDDGIPKARQANPERVRAYSKMPPIRITVQKNVGLHAAWLVYRGAGDVEFEPAQIKTWEDTRSGANSPWAPVWVPPALPADGRHQVTVRFKTPGTYVLRARADDGALTGDAEITVVVTP